MRIPSRKRGDGVDSDDLVQAQGGIMAVLARMSLAGMDLSNYDKKVTQNW